MMSGDAGMRHSSLGSLEVSRIGLGTMGMSAYYNGAGSDARSRYAR